MSGSALNDYARDVILAKFTTNRADVSGAAFALARVVQPPSRSPPMQKQAVNYALVLACGCAAAIDTFGADSIGVVKTVKGSVHIERTAQSVDAAVGSEVFKSDRIVTGPASSVGITLRDNTLLSEGSSSVLELNQFAFDTTTHDGTLDATIRRGSLAVVDGKLAKAHPEAVRFSTPTTTLGVRGTEFIIEVGDGENGR
ncbi:FecR family protein [Paraburkholderia steynii]|uniref:FecR family protein n=2 Tax=Burkholderiaceae TaxID=119060 RepID=A0A7Z7FFN0_9BURK|nr:FecR family protein [Paraburkholderia steynii]